MTPADRPDNESRHGWPNVVPPQRQQQFREVAALSKVVTVTVAVRNDVVRHQYLLGVRAAGGNVDNLSFLVIPEGAP